MNLQDHFLIAMPSLDDPYFGRSVVYLCEHNENGAMGLVINKPIDKLSIHDVLQKLKIISETDDKKVELGKLVIAGGPVSEDHGFILHSAEKRFSTSITLTDSLYLTTSKDVLETLGTDEEPDHYLMTLGYASWEKGQLEREILDNSWLVTESSEDIIFNTPIADRWHDAAQKLGINIYTISQQAGHA